MRESDVATEFSGWTRRNLRSISSRIAQRNVGNNRNVLTISARFGLVSQEEFFNRQVASADLSQYFKLERGDFAYNKSYSAGYSAGVVRRLELYETGVVSPLYICFRVDPAVADPGFIEHYFESGILNGAILNIAKEGVRNHGLLNVKVGDFFALDLDLPELDEQLRIAEILDEVNRVKRSHQRVLDKLSLVRTELIRHAMTEGVVRSRATLGELSDLIVDGVHHTPTYRDSGVPFVTVENLTRGAGISLVPVRYISREDHVDFCRRASPSPGDILVSKDGTLGVARVVPAGLPEFSIFVSVALIRPKRSLLNSRYGCMFFESPEFFSQLRRLSSGTGLNHIHLRDFRKFELDVPGLDAQEEWSFRLKGVDNSIQKEQELLLKVEKIGQSLVDDLLAGRVRVPVGGER
ncbi:restriction endonuclease subunit S [Streptomyces sp. NBC_00726]|uniref:restriction endonuclease subunit S n=1 Tax=Streptomyces sp. NBC_00726 TaxID=2903674 RepID=UPI0038642EA8